MIVWSTLPSFNSYAYQLYRPYVKSFSWLALDQFKPGSCKKQLDDACTPSAEPVEFKEQEQNTCMYMYCGSTKGH